MVAPANSVEDGYSAHTGRCQTSAGLRLAIVVPPRKYANTRIDCTWSVGREQNIIAAQNHPDGPVLRTVKTNRDRCFKILIDRDNFETTIVFHWRHSRERIFLGRSNFRYIGPEALITGLSSRTQNRNIVKKL